jgi:hypothetical protein
MYQGTCIKALTVEKFWVKGEVINAVDGSVVKPGKKVPV